MTLAVEGGKWTASRPCRLTRKETILRTVWLGGLVSRRSGVGAAVTKKKTLVSAPDMNPVAQPLYRHTQDIVGVYMVHEMKNLPWRVAQTPSRSTLLDWPNMSVFFCVVARSLH